MDLYYHPLSPPARAVYVLAKTLKVNFNEKLPDLLNNELKTPEYLKLNPSHTIPTLVDNGFALFESRAILGYLCDKYGGEAFYPKDVQKRAKVDCVLYFDCSSVWASVKECRIARYFKQLELTQTQIDEFKEKMEVLVKVMGDNKFMAGDKLTIADISVVNNTAIFMNDPWVPEAFKQWYARVLAELPLLKPFLDAEPEGVKQLCVTLANTEFAKKFAK